MHLRRDVSGGRNRLRRPLEGGLRRVKPHKQEVDDLPVVTEVGLQFRPPEGGHELGGPLEQLVPSATPLGISSGNGDQHIEPALQGLSAPDKTPYVREIPAKQAPPSPVGLTQAPLQVSQVGVQVDRPRHDRNLHCPGQGLDRLVQRGNPALPLPVRQQSERRRLDTDDSHQSAVASDHNAPIHVLDR